MHLYVSGMSLVCIRMHSVEPVYVSRISLAVLLWWFNLIVKSILLFFTPENRDDKFDEKKKNKLVKYCSEKFDEILSTFCWKKQNKYIYSKVCTFLGMKPAVQLLQRAQLLFTTVSVVTSRY